MHGLTGGSWKRDTDRATAAEKNDPRETGRSPRLRAYRRSSSPRQLPTLHRMSSGSYFPPPVRAVEIPKPHGGGTRMLGVPTIADRVAQTVVAEELAKRSRRSSTTIPMATGRAARRWTRWARVGNAVGKPTG